jgi:hypothetical protein
VSSIDASLNYRFYSGLAGLDSIRAPWVELADRLGPRKGLPHIPFWYRCQMRCLEDCAEMGFATAWDRERLAAVLPLVRHGRRIGRRKFAPLSTLALPDDPYNFFRDATIEQGPAPAISLAQLARVAGRSGSLRLGQLREDATLLAIPQVRELANASPPSPPSLYLPLSAGMRGDDPLSKQGRADLNKRRNRLRQLGPLQWKHAPDDLPLPEAIRIFIEMEASGWRGEAGTRTVTRCSPARTAFLLELCTGGDGLEVNVHLILARIFHGF